jgi:hypothetical protein
MSDLDKIRATYDRILDIETQAHRTLTAQLRAAGDDTHYFKASLQHYTDWLIANGYIDPEHNKTVGAYLDAMGGRSWPRRTMLKARKILQSVRKEYP